MQGNTPTFGTTLRVLFTLVLSAVSVCLMAQDGILDIFGTVKDNETMKKMEGATVQVTQDGKQFDNFTTAGNGKYEFELPLGYRYKLTFTNGGFFNRSVEIDTKGIPEEDMAGGFQLNMDMSLLTENDCLDPQIMNKSIGKAAFDPVRNAVEFDFDYTSAIQREIDDEIKRCEEMEEKMEEMLEEFQKLIEEGDGNMTAEKYEKAIENYEDALDIFPDKEPAPEKLAAAQEALAAQQAAAELEKRYLDLLSEARNAIKKEEYTDAEASLNEALTLKPDEREPKELLDEIAEKIAEQQKREQYESLVASADEKFEDENYTSAIADYRAALELFGTEKYPRDQISEAERIMSERDAAAEAEAEREAEYQRLIDLGESNLSDDKLEAALRNFEDAAKVKEEERYPKEKAEEIRQLIEDRKAASAAEAAEAEAAELERAYQDKVREADELFSAEKLEAARAAYEEASDIKPEEQYPKGRIDRIDDLIAEREAEADARAKEAAAADEAAELDRQYEDKVREADQLFSSDQLEDARTAYQEALDIKPGEKYPRSRIIRIDELIDERKAEAEAEALADAEADREAERRAAEEAAQREREELERQKEEERQRRLDEEAARREELAAEKARKEEEERKRSEQFANNASSSTEDEAERYYREARESEERAKTKAIQAKKEQQSEFIADKSADAENRREDNLEAARDKDDRLEKIYRDGEMNRDERVREKEREKERASDDQSGYAERAEGRRDMQVEHVEEKEEALAALSDMDRHRETRVANMEVQKEAYEENQRDYVAKGTSLRSSNDYDVKRQKERQLDMQVQGEEVRLESVAQSEDEKEREREFQQDLTQASQEMRAISVSEVEDKKEQLREISEDKEKLREDKQYEIEKKKEEASYMLDELGQEARERSYNKRDELFDKYRGSEKDPEDYNLPPGAEDLEEGVQERSYEEGNRMIIERTVKRGNKVDTYRKVISKTGIYYFKNNRSITEFTWKRETLNATD